VPPQSLWHVSETRTIIEQDVKFQNANVRLSGTAYLPAAERKAVPGIVALHGASAPSRHSGLYQHLREGLPRIGIGVLLFDRRGTGKSSGSSKNTNYEILADDAIAGQNALGRLSPIDPRNVGFWGISQGGWIAILATSRSKCPSFAISVSAPLVTPERQMEFATSNLLKVRGYKQNDVREMLYARKVWLAYLRGRVSLTVATRVMRRVERKPWFKLAFMPKSKELKSSHNALKELYYDPLDALCRVHVPLLLIYGSEDPWIPVKESLRQLRMITTTNKEKRRNNISYTVIPNANHEMMFKEKENMEFDEEMMNKRSAPEAPAYFMEMTAWLSKHLLKHMT
jgi:alpha-beta hydrolase superfamily lysophospholipase